MNAKQKIHQASLTKWAALVHDQKESGLSIDKWCSREGISKRAYNYWKHILKEEALKSVDLPEIVPVLPPADASSSPNSLPTLYNTTATSVAQHESRDSRKSCFPFGACHRKGAGIQHQPRGLPPGVPVGWKDSYG